MTGSRRIRPPVGDVASLPGANGIYECMHCGHPIVWNDEAMGPGWRHLDAGQLCPGGSGKGASPGAYIACGATLHDPSGQWVCRRPIPDAGATHPGTHTATHVLRLSGGALGFLPGMRWEFSSGMRWAGGHYTRTA